MAETIKIYQLLLMPRVIQRYKRIVSKACPI